MQSTCYIKPNAALHCHMTCCICCSAREVQLSSLSPVLSQMTATAIPIPGLVPCNPLPPSHPHHASVGTFSASSSEESGSQAESAGAPDRPYQVSSADLVTVSSFKPAVHVMSTKTRPKRIGIVGSDGRTYTFLLKVRLLISSSSHPFTQSFTHAYIHGLLVSMLSQSSPGKSVLQKSVSLQFYCTKHKTVCTTFPATPDTWIF